VIPFIAVSIACALLAAWILGVICSDRFLLSQWCSWIPSVLLLPIGLLGCWGSRNRVIRTGWCMIALLAPAWWFVVDDPWNPGTGEPGGLSLLQWTMSHDKSDRVAHARFIIEMDADITILTHGYGVRGTEEILSWLGPDTSPYKYGFFTILTKLPVHRLRSVISAQDIHVQVIEIDTTRSLGRPLHILAVDLPSDPMRSRMEIARTLRGWMDERDIPEPDLVLGDFNMRRGSSAINLLFPDLENAWDLGGRGWGPTFHRLLPIYQIDHVLVSNWLEVLEYRTANPGLGRHRVQLVRLQGNQVDEP
jgi:hypothetical protein